MEEPVISPVPSDVPELPPSVYRTSVQSRQIFLIGTAHVSQQSVNDVRQTIDLVQPDAVCVELCESRYRNLTDQEQWRKTNVVKILRQGKAALLLASLIMTSFQRRIGKKLGVIPGAEMLAGVEMAHAIGACVVLVDRDIQITLKRTWGQLSFGKKLKMATQLAASLFAVEDIDEKMIEEIKQKEKLADVLDVMASEFPQVKGALIDERDVYMAQKIREVEAERVVAIVGAGHVPGILKALPEQQDIAPLEELPQPSRWPAVLKWAIPGLILAMLVYGFIRGDAEQSIGSVYIWILVNGGLAALGAALALGHPLTIISAFIAAPLTSLNPLIAAGWVTGLVQAFIKKPTVEDLEALPEAITSVKGFWLNPVSRILLVVVLSNLGSVLGTFISGSWIAARSLSSG